MTCLEQQHLAGPVGSLDGDGAGDHDRPFGWRPCTSLPFPPAPLKRGPAPLQRGFNTRQYARLLVFRTHIQEYPAGEVRDDGTYSLAAAA
jgi:hypothetical protein